jgi:hypothetical protein
VKQAARAKDWTVSVQGHSWPIVDHRRHPRDLGSSELIEPVPCERVRINHSAAWRMGKEQRLLLNPRETFRPALTIG